MHLLKCNSGGRFDLIGNLAGSDIPEYAILSHTWGADTDELTFQDLKNNTGQNKSGYRKLQFCGEQAKRDGLQYFWVDTCCIDKSSSAELQEAINSMFRWYRNAARCYVYLADVSTSGHNQADLSWQSIFKAGRWFTRGWTLQELIAPRSVEFFCSDGLLLGDKTSLEQVIHEITGIETSALHGQNLSDYSVDQRMSWAKNRETKREEDRAYCLLGIFDVHMPLIYGERSESAFRRLREEIEKRAKKHTLNDTPAFSTASLSSTKRSKISHDQSSNDLSRLQTSENPEPVYEYPTHDIDATTRQSIIDQLYFPKIDERLTSLTAAQGTTCRWFLTKSEYLSWNDVSKRQDHEGFLWIKGNPGTGKSTLMKLLFEEAKLKAKGDFSKITLSFFFLARGTIEERTTTGLYRSLLHQLFEKVVELRDSLDWMTADGARGVERNGWSESALKQTLKHAVEKLGSRSLMIFVDALDECDQKQTSGMVFFFEELCELAEISQVSLQICFSSRHYPTIVIQKGIELILEDEIGHMDDIQQYIKSKLRLGKSKQAETLRTEILQKSSGIFLWVVLVLDILNSEYSTGSSSIKKVSKRLTEIPPGLNDLFEMILKRDGENLEELQLCLKLILFANRPLKPQEIYFATQIGLDGECMGFWDQEDVNIDQMKLFVRSSSKGLAEVTKNKASDVQFIHESVRDFLLGRYESQWSESSGNFVGHGHDTLKNCCLAQLNAVVNQKVIKCFNFSESNFWECRNMKYPFLNTTHPEAGIPPAQRFKAAQSECQEEIKSRFPFLDYSVSNILYHANLAQQDHIEQADFLAKFPTRLWVFVNNYLENHEIRRYTESVTTLYLLAERNLASLIRIYPQKNSCFDVEEQRYGPSIFAALATESHEAVQALLEIELETYPSDSLVLGVWKQHYPNVNKGMNIGRSFTYPRKRDVRSYLSDNDLEIPLIIILSSQKYIGKLDEGIEGGENLLFRAIARKQEIVAEFLLESGAGVKYTNEQMDTLLLKVIAGGTRSTVKLLLEKGARVDHGEIDRETPLKTAIQCRQEDIVRLLLEKGAEINNEGTDGKTPLITAIQCGYKDIIGLLLEKGAEINNKGINETTPLAIAVNWGNENITQLLLEKGAEIDCRDLDGETPLMAAVYYGFQNIVELLLKKGAEIDCRNLEGKTPLMIAVSKRLQNMVELLLEKGAEIDCRDLGGETPLMTAVYYGFQNIVELLLEKGAEIDCRDLEGKTPLMIAVSKRLQNMIELLLEKGAEVNCVDFQDRTPITKAIFDRNTRIASLLLGKGARFDCEKDVFGIVLLDASQFGREEMANFLLKNGMSANFRDKNELYLGWTPLMHGARWGHEAIVKLCLENGAEINAKCGNGLTSLDKAVKAGHMNVVELLLKRGSEVDLRIESSSISNGRLSILKLLLTQSYGIDGEDGEGRTPLFWAIDSLREDMVSFLLDSGASIESKDKYGCTPLMYAMLQGAYLPAVKTLLDRGADINAENIEGSSPLSIIKRSPTLINWLKKKIPGFKIDR
ncbi:hypothetical protein BOTCAL_0106g00010 [Botryotinia calthae]|uniref:Uncharacterized protein n=1 Tax=Botryotinia calthae TaxID=38488 RepID=A0A4Y8D896_9HELO|nr:hypothetical protein BOTCAL_0106g00010 [Botryotinia calthae]